MEFAESTLESQTRRAPEFHHLDRGRMTSLEFRSVFEALLDAMGLVGLVKSELDLKLAYLLKIGARTRQEVLKDRRTYAGESASRVVNTWEEAHRVAAELESMEPGTRSFVASLAEAEARGSTLIAPVTPAQGGSGPDRPKGICYRARGKGKCDAQGCTWDHDPTKWAAVRKEQEKK